MDVFHLTDLPRKCQSFKAVFKKTFYELPPQIYDDQFWWKKDDLEFWKYILRPANNSILELAAGTGRVAQPLLREGFNYTGLEISDAYCNHANQSLNYYGKLYNNGQR